MASGLRIQVNGKFYDIQSPPDTPLLYVLRDELGLQGPKFGCGLSQCGACSVLHGDVAIRSCVTAVSKVTDPVTTLEGLGTQKHPGRLQQAFLAEQAGQCAYCIPGMIITAEALLRKTPVPTDADIRTALNGNLCRCGSHLRIMRAVKRAAQTP